VPVLVGIGVAVWVILRRRRKNRIKEGSVSLSEALGQQPRYKGPSWKVGEPPWL